MERECAPKTTGTQGVVVDLRAAVVHAVSDVFGSLLLGALPPEAEKADVVARERLLECYAFHPRSSRKAISCNDSRGIYSC